MITVPKYYFVNKDAASGKLTQSRGTERSEIFSHAQRITSDRAQTSGQDSWHVYQSPKDWTPQRKAGSRRSADRLSNSKDLSRPKKLDSKTTPVNHSSPPPSLPKVFPLNKVVGASGDPFDSHQISFTPRVHYLFRIWSGDIAPLLFPGPVAIPSQNYTLSLALGDSLMGHSLLSLVLTRMYSCSGESAHQVSAMAFKHEALVYIRQLIASSGGERVNISHCYAISMLIWIECLIGNFEDLKAHVSGLQYLIHRADDIHTTPIYILRIIYACSYLCTALLNMPPPVMPVQTSDESGLSSEAKAIIQAAQEPDYKGEGHSWFLPGNLKLLGPSLTPVAVECHKVALIRKGLAIYKWGPNNEELRYIVLKEALTEYELLSLPFDVSLSPCQDAIRLALFINSVLPVITATGPSAALSRILAKQIRHNIESSELSTHWTSCSELLLWVLVIGALISQEDVEWPWFRTRIFTLVDELGLESASGMTIVLKGFHYTRYLQGTVEAIWREYESRMLL